MTNLVKMGDIWVNPANIAYLSPLKKNDGTESTTIHFNAYAAAANEMQSAFETLWVEVAGQVDANAFFINSYQDKSYER